MKFSVFHSDIVKSLLLIFSASCFAGNTNDNSINIAGYGVDELPGDIYSSVNTAPRKIGDIYHTPTFHMDYEPSSIPESGAENATLLHHFTCKNSFTS